MKLSKIVSHLVGLLVSRCGFNFRFLMINVVENFFIQLLVIGYPLFWKVCSSLLPIFLLSRPFIIGFFKHPGYKPLVRYMHANTFFHFIRYLFTHFWWKEILNIVEFINFLCLVLFESYSRDFVLPQDQKNVFALKALLFSFNC